MRFLPISLLLLLFPLVSACTDPGAFYRMVAPETGVCGDVYRLGDGNREWREKGPVENHSLRCFLQAHELPRVTEADTPSPWEQEAIRRGARLNGANGYHLAFVEMADDNRLHLPEQLDRLSTHLAAQRRTHQNNYLIAYVHGWRHDAQVLDRDLENFRVVLAYARAALNTRCIARREYCDTSLTGAFISWRGRQFKEPPEMQGRGGDPFVVGAAASFWNRLSKSSELGREEAVLSAVLDQLQGDLRLNSARKDADKFLVFGHSMGGNMLATLMEQRYLKQLKKHRAPAVGKWGHELRPVLADLVVLLNPAARAQKWTSLQRAERALAGLENANYLTSNDGGKGVWEKSKSDRLQVWRALYPFTQRPVYISLTSTSNWNLGEGRGREVESDAATGRLFPLGQELAGAKQLEDRLAIGHLLPRYRKDRLELIEGVDPVGTTHEFIVRSGPAIDVPGNTLGRKRASYLGAVYPQTSWCDPANGWLLSAREAARDANGSRFDQFWAYGEGTENVAPGRNHASVLWRHQINLDDKVRGLPVVPGTSPFWNVRAFDTAIRGHSKWVSYPMWCALNQIVLDDVTARRKTDRNVDLVIEAQPEQLVGEAVE